MGNSTLVGAGTRRGIGDLGLDVRHEVQCARIRQGEDGVIAIVDRARAKLILIPYGADFHALAEIFLDRIFRRLIMVVFGEELSVGSDPRIRESYVCGP